MTFYYKNVELNCPDHISKSLSEYLNYYNISSRDFFETLEKIGFTFPIHFIDLLQHGKYTSVLISSADDSMYYQVKLHCEISGIRAITLIDECAREECSYQLSTGKPIKYLFSIIGGCRSVEFSYSDSKVGFKFGEDNSFSIKFRDSFNNFEFTALLSNIQLDYSPIPNLLENDEFSTQLDEIYASIIEYILDLEWDSNIKKIYKKLYKFYSARSCTLSFKGTENHITFPNLVYNKISVNDGKLTEVTEFQSFYNGIIHMFDNGDRSFETQNRSLKFYHSKCNYSFVGEWNEAEIRSIKDIIKCLKKADYSKSELFINELYAESQE